MSLPIRIVGNRTAGPSIRLVLDEKALARADARLAKYQGKPLQMRAQRAYLEGARLMVAPMRAAAPRGATGRLRSSVSARPNRPRIGEMAAATVGTRFRAAPHRHLVTAGTKPHSLAPVRPGKKQRVRFADGNVRWARTLQHPGSRAQPFVGEVTDRLGTQVQHFIARRVLDIGGVTTSFG